MGAVSDENASERECPGCAARDRKIAELEARLGKLEALVRAGKRQAAPFSKGLLKADPKRPEHMAACRPAGRGAAKAAMGADVFRRLVTLASTKVGLLPPSELTDDQAARVLEAMQAMNIAGK